MTSKYRVGNDLVDLIENQGLKSAPLVREMKDRHGIRSLPMLLALLGDGDWSSHTLFSHFKLTSLVKASYQLRENNVVIDDAFLKRLENECFWYLNRSQSFRVSNELLFLFPERFGHLSRWMSEKGA